MDPRVFRQWSPPTRSGARAVPGVGLAKAVPIIGGGDKPASTPKIVTPGAAAKPSGGGGILTSSTPKPAGGGKVLGPSGSPVSTPKPSMQPTGHRGKVDISPKPPTPSGPSPIIKPGAASPKPTGGGGLVGPTGEKIGTPKPTATAQPAAAPQKPFRGKVGTAEQISSRQTMQTGLSAVHSGSGPERKQKMQAAAAELGARQRQRQAGTVPGQGAGPDKPKTMESPAGGAPPDQKTPSAQPEGPEMKKPDEKAGAPDSKPVEPKGPNLLGAYQFGHRVGSALVSDTGPAQLANIGVGRAVAGVHGLLNRKTPHHYESARLGREAELSRRTMERRQAGEAGGVVTQSSMQRSIGEMDEMTKSLSAVLVRSGVRRMNNGS